MKLIRKCSLVRRQPRAVIHCEIELCEASGIQDRYVVNLRQGRIGDEWRESTRTPQPVDLAAAEKLFSIAVAERSAQGFIDPDTVPPSPSPSPGATPQSAADPFLLNRLPPVSWKQLTQRQRSRTIWRIGERRLRAAVPALVDLIERGDAMQDYCIAWAIGRCGDRGALIAMQELRVRSPHDAVRRMAHQAWLMLAGETDLASHADALVAAWPPSVRAAWAAQDDGALLTMAAGDDEWLELKKSDWLEQLYQVSLVQPLARRVLLAHLQRMRLRPGTFRAVRRIYKAAEMRSDGEVFGLLQRRFELSPHTTAAHVVYVRRSYVPYAKEAAQPDSAVAYSNRTRDYLRRRGWRTLRRLAEDNDPAFIAMALGALNAMDDSDAGQPATRGSRAYGPYSHWLLFNRLLRQRGPWRSNRAGTTWYQERTILADDVRQEAYPAMWDAHPDALLYLMRQNRCSGVHEFAARALRDNTQFCAQLPVPALRELLSSPYPATARFAFLEARRRFEPGSPPTEWLLLFIQSALEEAIQYVLDCITGDPARYGADPLLVAAIATSPLPAARRQARLLCQCALSLPGKPEQIVAHLIDWLANCGDLDDAEQQVPAITADLGWLLENPLRAAAAGAPYGELLPLLSHRLAAVRALACLWLSLHATPAAMLPAATLAALLRDPDATVRTHAVRLFGMLPDHVLAAQADLTGAFATSPDAGMRRAIDPVIQRIAPADHAFRDALLATLIDNLFRAETGEGAHADALAWIAGPLRGAPSLADTALLQRLLAARSKGAQQLGAQLLPDFNAQQFDVATWAAFGRNPVAAVRQWAYAAFRSHPDRARANLEDALRLFDSRFDDTREFAAAYFAEACTRDDWTPLLLVSLCDHPDPAAQRFGRAMITTHFDVADVTETMAKLSQHPSANMQLFVSNWLESASAGDVTKLQRLEPYFLAVLSQVNRGRVAKGRVQSFLREQAAQSEDIAAFVARLFARQVVTVAIADKAQYIEGLRAIQQRYPSLPAVMTVHTPGRRQ